MEGNTCKTLQDPGTGKVSLKKILEQKITPRIGQGLYEIKDLYTVKETTSRRRTRLFHTENFCYIHQTVD